MILVGHLGSDPEIKVFDSGNKVAQFRMATSESYTDPTGVKHDLTEWHNIVLSKGLAGVAEQYMKKGDGVYIEGRIRNRQYTDKDGNNKFFTEIVGREMVMLGKSGQGGGSNAPTTSQVNEPTGPAASPDDDLPF